MVSRLDLRAGMSKLTLGVVLTRCLSLAFFTSIGMASPTVNSSTAVVPVAESPRYYSPAVINVGFSDSRGFAPVIGAGDGDQGMRLRTREEQPRWVF
ncbi:hypothetical protein LZV00_20995 [Pseudomonas kielensis]|uniref:hypothetical protein n=1 Tax=Pseudomonas kielensis TaxID=2762577 RepID=UPI0022402892|nr:hypothetical protein [Pseudomonas kielensis]UZM13129.1 hypothetical protein LZV00_20995 [Pseudomonas kielensis]